MRTIPCGDDQGGGDTDAGFGGPAENAAVYAHSASELYRVDPDSFTVTLVAPFGWSAGADQMPDIAIDRDGLMLGVSYDSVYRIDPVTAQTTRLSNNPQGMFNGLSFVPAGQVGFPEGPDVLVGARNSDGKIFSIDPSTGAVTQVGDMGAGYTSSGDLVSISAPRWWGAAVTTAAPIVD